MAPTESPPLRIALLGAGTFAASAHHAALTSLIADSRIEITLVWSRTASSAKNLAASYSSMIPFCFQLASHSTALDSAAAALEQNKTLLDAVIIALPPGAQEQFATLAFNNGLHVMLEKPLALDLVAARKLLSTPEADGEKVLALAENYRFEPVLRHAHELVKEVCGGVVAARFAAHSPMKEGSRYGQGWRLQMDGPGILLDGCVHHIAALRVVLGCDVERVNATCSRWAGWFKGNDTVSADLGMANGMSVSMFVTYAGNTVMWELRVVGKEGDVVVERMPGKPGYRVSAVRMGQSGQVVGTKEMPFGGIDGEFDAFVESCVHRKVHPELDARKGFNDVATVFAMFESSKKKTQVVVATINDSD